MPTQPTQQEDKKIIVLLMILGIPSLFIFGIAMLSEFIFE